MPDSQFVYWESIRDVGSKEGGFVLVGLNG